MNELERLWLVLSGVAFVLAMMGAIIGESTLLLIAGGMAFGLFIIPHFIRRPRHLEAERYIEAENDLEKLLWPGVTAEELADYMLLQKLKLLREVYKFDPIERSLLDKAITMRRAIDILATGEDPYQPPPKPIPPRNIRIKESLVPMYVYNNKKGSYP